MALLQMGDGHNWPFAPGKRQVKFLLMVVDYFSKWIEAEPVATITSNQVQNFV